MKQIELTPKFSLSQIVYGVWRWDENKQLIRLTMLIFIMIMAMNYFLANC
jgi:hypothetical protein